MPGRRERERTPNQAKGWLWSEDSRWRVTTEAGGPCVTYETLALTRDIPWGLAWLLRPIADRFPAETLTNMLDRTRASVQMQQDDAQQVRYVFPTTDHSFTKHLGH
jgi:hypothetical protein